MWLSNEICFKDYNKSFGTIFSKFELAINLGPVMKWVFFLLLSAILKQITLLKQMHKTSAIAVYKN